MTDIAVPLPDGRWLVLSRDVFQQALVDGASVAATNTTQSAVVDHEERWLTSQQLAEHTGI